MDVTKTLHRRYKDVTQTLQGPYCKVLIKFVQMLAKYDQHDQIHVEIFQELHFLRIKSPTPSLTWDLGWGDYDKS